MNAARLKVEAEGRCRACGTGRHLEAAHIVARGRTFAARGYDDPLNIVPLCNGFANNCHYRYDHSDLDLLGLLTPAEEARAVVLAGGLELARRRLCPSAYRQVAA